MGLPLKVSYAFAVFVSDLHYLFAARDKKTVTQNLKAIFPEKSDKEIAYIRIWMFRNFAKYLVDFFRFETLDRDYIGKKVKVINKEYVDRALAKGKGAILLTAHLGNWELGGVVIALLGYPLWAVALTHKHGMVNDFFNRQRLSKGLNVMPLGKAARTCIKVLRENKPLALVGDRDFAESGRTINFFGKPTFLPEGPAAFSLRTGAAIIPGFMLRNSDDSFTLKFDEPVEFTPGGNREEDTLRLMEKYKAVLEKYIKETPEQWYMFRRFWKNENLRNNSHL